MTTHRTQPPPAAARSARINLRATERQEALLRQAAASSETSLTEFILGRAITEAERVLADRRWFTTDEAQFAEFTRLLEAPLPSTEKLARLLSDSGPVGEPFDVGDAFDKEPSQQHSPKA